ncbi:MAG TPA: hypothetical protein VF064_05355, partial [Pyrinomonadaceae bacterium]
SGASSRRSSSPSEKNINHEDTKGRKKDEEDKETGQRLLLFTFLSLCLLFVSLCVFVVKFFPFNLKGR